MPAETARELIDKMGPKGYISLAHEQMAGGELARRVERILALEPREWAGYDACLVEVKALLNGEPA